jgi:Domain of unknown function (DUF4349)
MKMKFRPALAVLGTIAAITLFSACGDDAADGDNSGSPSVRDAASRFEASGTTTANDAAAPATGGASPSGETAQLPSQAERKIIYNATISLEVTDLSRAFSEVGAIARVAGGFVEKSSFSEGDDPDDASRGASLTVRVPADQYQDALSKLRTLQGAKVKQEGSKSTEVTEQYTDLQSRLRVLQSTERQYLLLLEQAKTIPDILAMTDRLNSVRTQIEQVQGRVNVLDHLTELASIDVSLLPAPAADVKKPDNGPRGVGESFVDAWSASLTAARYLASLGAMLAVVVVWLAIPAAVVLFITLRIRRRQAALAAE